MVQQSYCRCFLPSYAAPRTVFRLCEVGELDSMLKTGFVSVEWSSRQKGFQSTAIALRTFALLPKPPAREFWQDNFCGALC